MTAATGSSRCVSSRPVEECADDPLLAARARPDVLFVRGAPQGLAPGTRALGYVGARDVLLVTAARDFAGGFTLHGEASAPTAYRPTEIARAASDEREPWDATLARAGRLIAQLSRWLDAELALSARERDLAALERWRRSELAPACPVTVNNIELAWCPAQACWSCLDFGTGEVVRLAVAASTLRDLALAGGEALSLAGRAWAYSLSDRRTPVAVVSTEGGGWKARRASTTSGNELVVFSAGRQVGGTGGRAR